MAFHFHSIADVTWFTRKVSTDTDTWPKKNNQSEVVVHGKANEDQEYLRHSWHLASEIVSHPAHHHHTDRTYWPFGTYKFYEVPPNFKEFNIFTGYRSPTSTVKECFKYLFYPNNEMMNVWTHLIAFLCTVFYVFHIGTFRDIDFYEDSYSWPLLTYLISCCIYPIVSAGAHLFSCVSSRMRHVLFFCDYAAISVYGLATNIAVNAYSFPVEFDGTSLKYLFLPISFYNSCLMPVLSCESRFVEFSPFCKKFRILGFIIPGVWGFAPLVWRITSGSSELNNVNEALTFHKVQLLTAVITSILYGTRFPESFYPGKVDIYFHSHQIFHCFCTASTCCQMWGIIADFYYFRDKPHYDPTYFTFRWSLGIWILAAIWNVTIVCCCIKRVFCFENAQLYQMLMHTPRLMCYPKQAAEETGILTSSSEESLIEACHHRPLKHSHVRRRFWAKTKNVVKRKSSLSSASSSSATASPTTSLSASSSSTSFEETAITKTNESRKSSANEKSVTWSPADVQIEATGGETIIVA